MLCNSALNIYMEIVRFQCNKFFLITSGRYSSGTCPLHPIQKSHSMQILQIIITFFSESAHSRIGYVKLALALKKLV